MSRQDAKSGQVRGGKRGTLRVEAEAGIPWLVGDSSRLTVRAMGRLHGGALEAIERQGFDVFRARARVSTRRKLATLAACQLETTLDAWRRFWA